jgi:hypothetical protein
VILEKSFLIAPIGTYSNKYIPQKCKIKRYGSGWSVSECVLFELHKIINNYGQIPPKGTFSLQRQTHCH